MIKWFSLFFVLLIIATGCQTYRGDGAAAGAGTYPLKTSPAGEDTVLITVVDSSKAGGFDIRRTPMANIPVSTPVQTALNLKQDASTAVTADDVQDAIDEAIAGVDGSTIAADTTDPTKAAAAVAADSATYATTAGTAGTVAAVSGDSVTSGTVADARIASTIARDSEVASSISSAIAGKFDTPTGTTSQVVLGDGTLGSLPAGSTISADTTDNTKAAAAVVADSASALTPSKVSGVPSVTFFHEAEGTGTNGNGIVGPASATKNILYRIGDESPAVGQVLKIDSIATDQAVSMGAGSMVADIVTLILADESGGGASLPSGTTTNDILKWDGDSWEPCALSAHPEFASLLAALNNAGFNSFTFTPGNTFPLWINGDGVTLSVDVTDTSSSYAVDSVAYQTNGAGGFVNALTNTSGDTWTASFDPATDGTYTVQYRAADDKSTPNTGDSSTYTIYRDATDPVVGTVTPDPATHDGTGSAVEVTIASITEANEASRQYRIYDVTDAAVEESYQTFTGLTINETLPADQHTYRFDILVTDLAGNIGTASSSNIVYQAVAVNPTYSWPCTDNAASTVVLSDVGGSSATLINAGNTSAVSLDGGFNMPDTAYVSASIPDTLWESGIFTVQGRFRVTRTIGTAWNYIFVDSSGSNQFTVLWAEDTHYVRLYTNGVDRGWSNVAIPLNDLTERYIRVTHNTNTASLYAGTDEGSLSLVYTWATSTAPTNAGVSTRFGGNGSAGSTFKGKISGWKVWTSAVTP